MRRVRDPPLLRILVMATPPFDTYWRPTLPFGRARRVLNGALGPQGFDGLSVQAEPFGQDGVGVFAEHGGRADRRGFAVHADGPAGHLEVSVLRMVHHLHDAAVLEGLVVVQFHGVEHGSGRDTSLADGAHGVVLGWVRVQPAMISSTSS